MSDEQKFKVVIKGNVLGTRVFAPDGSDISNHVRSVEISQKAGELPSVRLEVYKCEVSSEIAPENVTQQTVVQDVSGFGDEFRVYKAASK